MRYRLLFPVFASLLTIASPAVEVSGDKKDAKPVIDEAGFLKSLTSTPGFSAHIWAAGTQVLNPIAIDIDERGRVFAAESFRWRLGGVIDVRDNMFLYRDDLKVETVADRLAMIEKWKDKFPKDFFTKLSERVKLIEDSDSDGRADRDVVWADGFRDAADGPVAGVLAFDGTVYMADIPRIWALRGKDRADSRTVLSEGYGPRFSISGHDLHGLAMGPDGRLYFSVGDRGYDLTTKEGVKLAEPRRGATFRCEPDGANLEIVYLGLRNPQELAFDAWGNLFTVDNNADMGDQARVSYLMEGGTSGWDHGWQLLGNESFAKAVGLEGRQPDPWLEEGLWKSHSAEQPAWVLPPVGHITSGPSGLAFCPGAGFSEQLDGHFLVCDYRGGADSGVWSFKLDESGAGFVLPDAHKKKFLWGLPPTDVTFGYDGRIYVADYIGGWIQNEHGRILTVRDTAKDGNPAAREVTALMASGFNHRSLGELKRLLGHGDMRVRQRAQFALAKRGADGRRALVLAANGDDATPLARAHGIWGLWQQARRDAGGDAATVLIPLLGDRDARVREQAAKVLGDLRHAKAASELTALLNDGSARVRAAAAIAVGRLRFTPALGALVRVLNENSDQDPYLRHAAVMGLAGCADARVLRTLADDQSPAVRMGALLALRRSADPALGVFLEDAAPLVRAEAIRAVYDLMIEPAIPALIAQLGRPLPAGLGETTRRMLALRLVNAAYRWGGPETATGLASFAATGDAPEDVRAVALKALAKWEKPSWIDPLVGYPREAQRRELGPDAAAVKSDILRIIDKEEEQLLGTAVKLAQTLGYGVSDKTLIGILDNRNLPAEVRAEALSQLSGRKSVELGERLPKLLTDGSGVVRSAAFDAVLANDRAAGLSAARAVLADDGTTGGRDISVVTDRAGGDWASLSMGAPVAELDLARAGIMTWVDVFSKPHHNAGTNGRFAPRLNDGQLSENDDDIARSTWFDEHEARFVLDLKQETDVGRVDTWSWHKANRSPQEFVLWAAGGEAMPDTGATNLAIKWTRLARVSSVHLGEGGKHGSSVLNTLGSLGKYRWLLWQATRKGIFFTEVAVYPQGKVPGGLVRAVGDRTLEGWDDLAMHAPAAGGTPLADALAAWVPNFGKPKGDPANLFKGGLPANDDDLQHNTWSDDGESRLLVDLRQPRDLGRINTYSWHRKERAAQAFTLWASVDATAPDAAAKDLGKAGWRRIAGIDTAGQGEGGRHGSSVLPTAGSLGVWRWLLWQNAERKEGTFLSRIDLHPAGTGLPALKRQPGRANVVLRQHVLNVLGTLDDPAAGALIGDWLDRQLEGKAPTEIQLELAAAAAARKEPEIADRLARWQASLKADDALAKYRVALAGGDAEKGRELFKFHVAQCIKCHSVNRDGGNAGPDLMGIGLRLRRGDILESIVAPNAVVVPGFGVATVTLTDGSTIAGSLLKNDPQDGVLVKLADNSEKAVPAVQIAGITPPTSPMPPLGEVLTRAELRDVMAYLVSLR